MRGCAQSHVPFAHHGVANNRTSPWAAHFAVTNVNGALEGRDGYTYDLEWSPDAINPPIRQRVRGVPPTYIECAPRPARVCAHLMVLQCRLRMNANTSFRTPHRGVCMGGAMACCHSHTPLL